MMTSHGNGYGTQSIGTGTPSNGKAPSHLRDVDYWITGGLPLFEDSLDML